MDSADRVIRWLTTESWHSHRLVWLFCSEDYVAEIVRSIHHFVSGPALLEIDLDAGGPAMLGEFLNALGASEVRGPLIEADLEHLLQELREKPEWVNSRLPARTLWLQLSARQSPNKSRAASSLAALRLASTFTQDVARIVVIDALTRRLEITIESELSSANDGSASWAFGTVDPPNNESKADLEDSSNTLDLGFTQWEMKGDEGLIAHIVLIAHPEGQLLGSRYRLSPGGTLEIGRSAAAHIRLRVSSLSRRHARLRYAGEKVVIEDLRSRNGTYVNGQRIHGRANLRSGDRFQTAEVHFKFLHEQDAESAYNLVVAELAARDGLTEVYNKSTYETEAQRTFSHSVLHNRPLSLIIFDLDEFKLVNDTYGRLCGDFFLRQVASLTRDLVRPEQVLARVGGDEFAILAPEAEAAGAEALATELHSRIISLDHRYGDLSIPISCSFGVAERNDKMTTPQDLYQAAGSALLLSKRNGRRRVSVWRAPY